MVVQVQQVLLLVEPFTTEAVAVEVAVRQLVEDQAVLEVEQLGAMLIQNPIIPELLIQVVAVVGVETKLLVLLVVLA